MTADLAGRVCLVTGASNGLGEATALALAAQGARVILVCRDAARGARALEDVKRRTGNGGVELVLADLGSLASIERAADLVAARHRRLDVLVNNAGLVTLRRTLTADGFEATFGVNHLGAFALTNRLLPLLRAGAPSRVVNVSSNAHRGVVLDFDDLQGERHYSFWTAYRRSKLANILFTAEFARRLSGSGVTANALDPGAVRTGLGGGHGRALDLLGRTIKLVFQSPARGARTQIYLATAPEVASATGGYFVRCRPVLPSAAARDENAQRQLWDVSRAMTGVG
jgi:NAD(P)-dependent dehydrogenase (short-subunit alcohol dehydrogenase family)